MRLGFSGSRNGRASSSSAGNQKRVVKGVSGIEYDMSFMSTMSESADQNLGERQCSLSINNVVARTSNNIDTRTAAEKMYSKSDIANFKFSVYFDKDMEKKVIEANRHLDHRFHYELDQIKSMNLSEYVKSEPDIIKIAAKMKAKAMIAQEGISSISQAEWNRALINCDAKAKQYGINTFELSCRASTRDQDLKRSENAWGITEAGFEAATYNAAGVKTLPLFDEKQVLAAKEVSESIYKAFDPMVQYAIKNPSDFNGMFEEFCKVCSTIDSNVPKDYKVKYNLFNDAQKVAIDKLAVAISNSIIGG